MQVLLVIIKLTLFFISFSLFFWLTHFFNILPEYKLEEDLRSIPTLFAAGNFIYSIVAAFIIQVQWHKWDKFTESNTGEVNMLRQLFVVAHHFPVKERNIIRFNIYHYTDVMITESLGKKDKDLRYRYKAVDDALLMLEYNIFLLSPKHPDIGPLAFGYLTRAMEYREQKLQNANQRLPLSLRAFIIFATIVVIFGSLFLPFTNVVYSYYFTAVLGFLAFGVYLIIDNFDHPYRPHASLAIYKLLKTEIKTKLEEYSFDFEKAEKHEHNLPKYEQS
jgi:hypothetical protein